MMKSLKVQKFKNFCLAALLIASAAFSACSSSDDNIANEQPANPTQPQVYTMVIKASKGGDATTRALQGGDGSVTAYWNGNEAIDVVQDNGTTREKIGTASAAESSDGSTTITATLTSEPTGDLYFVLGGTTWNYTGQNGILAAPESTQVTNISKDYDFAVAELAADKYTKNGTVITPGATLNFVSRQAIVKFILKDKANGAPINATQLTIDAKVGDESRLVQSFTLPSTQTLGPITINRTTPTDNVIYAALPFSSQADNFTFALTATDGTHNYTYEKAGVTMLNGRYYEVTVKMTRDTYPIALSEVTSDYIGSVVTTDGTVYATVADASAANNTAAGMIAYVSEIGQGLAIALADEAGEMNWSTAITTAAAHTPAVTGGRWCLPSAKDWQYMFIGCGSGESYNDPTEEMKRSYSELASKLTTAGGTALRVGEDYNYWSSSEENPGNYAWSLRFVGNDAIFLFGSEDLNAFVRACLAFGPARGHALASSAVGEIVGSDGLAYYTSDKNDLPSGVTAVGMVACKNNGSNGLVIALADETYIMDWSTAITTAAAHTPVVTGYSWKLPTPEEWNQMFSANGGNPERYEGLNTAITNAGGTALGVNHVYWSSTAANDKDGYAVALVYDVGYVHGIVSFGTDDKTNRNHVRACLAF